MADDTADLALNDAPELETAPQELDTGAEEEVFDLEADAGEGQEGEEGEGQESEEELEDVEFDGKTHKLPKGLKEALLRHDDYTRKTQTVAEERRALEQQRERIAQQAQASEAELDARVAIKAIDKRIAEFKDIDWRTWRRQDPAAAEEAKFELELLKEQRERGNAFLHQSEQQRIAEARHDYNQRRAETHAFATKEIKGWTPELDTKITNFAVSELGLTPQFLGESINPTLYKVLHRAYIGDQAMKRAASARTSSQKPPAQATSTVRTASSPRGSADLGSASMEAYVEARKRGVGGKSPLRG